MVDAFHFQQRDQINSEHKIKYLLDTYFSSNENLIKTYEDKDGIRKEEIKAMSGPNEFGEFYSRLKTIKEFYQKRPNEISVPFSAELDEIIKLTDSDVNLVEFTDEEGYGKFLDLNECFELYLNIKGIEKIDYLTYLSTFDRFCDISSETKVGHKYKTYLNSLMNYLYDYILRVKPLLDIEDEITKVEEDFEKQWASNSFPGWPKQTSSVLRSGGQLDLSVFSSPEELASLGLDRLKHALIALNMKCGG